jgi:hypothetical protein
VLIADVQRRQAPAWLDVRVTDALEDLEAVLAEQLRELLGSKPGPRAHAVITAVRLARPVRRCPIAASPPTLTRRRRQS